MMIVPFLAAVLLLGPQAGAPAAKQAPHEVVAEAPSILREIAVIGASLSAGFGLARADGEPLGVRDILAKALCVAPVEIRDSASAMFFLDPVRGGAKAVEKLLAQPPTLVVGLDFLFWFAYGAKQTEAQHLARLDQGLALLDRFQCPILVGDLPDVSYALEADIPMLRESQVPTPPVLKALNQRLAEWAKPRPRVVVFPLAEFSARMMSGQKVELRGNTWEDATDRLLQPDLLHPTLEGTIGVVELALDALVRARTGVTSEMVRWDVAALTEELAGK
jgi:hypothetical protein